MKRFLIGLFAVLGFFSTAIIILVIVVAKTSRVEQSTVPPQSVLYINFTDQMLEYDPEIGGIGAMLGQRHDSLHHLIQSIDRAKYDDRIVGIVARIDHAEMGISQIQELRSAIMRFRVAGRDQGKFTIAYADTFGEMGPGTGAYFLASAFEEVWVQPIGSVGLTGLIVQTPFAREAIDSLGLEPQIEKREEYKSFLDFLTESEFSEANRQSLESVLGSVVSQITREIAISRELTDLEVKEALDRGPLLAREAKRIGLVDRIAYTDELSEEIKKRLEVKERISWISPYQYIKINPDPVPKKNEPKIALIYGVGSIHRDQGRNIDLFGNKSMGGNAIAQAFKQAREDQDVVAIVFRIACGRSSRARSSS